MCVVLHFVEQHLPLEKVSADFIYLFLSRSTVLYTRSGVAGHICFGCCNRRRGLYFINTICYAWEYSVGMQIMFK